MTPLLLKYSGARIKLIIQTGMLCMLLLIMSQQFARADLMINPTRIVFDKNQRSAQIDLINNGTEQTTYRISVVNRRMSETGEFLPADTPQDGERFADAMIKFSPRQVVLPPGGAQVVRVLLRKPADLESGEYRSHLMFERIPEAAGETSINKQLSLASNEVGIQLTALIGVSLPIIVRHGDTSATVKISALQLQKPTTAGQLPIVSFDLERSGNRSVYGDLVASFSRDGEPAQIVGKAGGVAVYVPNPVRRAKLALQLPAGLNLAHGRLTLQYSERPEDGGKPLAESTIAIP